MKNRLFSVAHPVLAPLDEHRGKDIPEIRVAHNVRDSLRCRDYKGMRPSECIGLKWQDLDWERATVSVKRKLRKGPTGQWDYGETKRVGSRRLIRLQNWVLARLKQLREFQAAHLIVDPQRMARSR